MEMRTDYCGNITSKYENQNVTIYGWVQRVRKLGKLIFIDLRDREGIVQVVVNQDSGDALMDVAQKLGNEYVVEVQGKVVKRSNVNKEIKTGEVEINATNIVVLNESKNPPFEIKDDVTAAEQTLYNIQLYYVQKFCTQFMITLIKRDLFILKLLH